MCLCITSATLCDVSVCLCVGRDEREICVNEKRRRRVCVRVEHLALRERDSTVVHVCEGRNRVNVFMCYLPYVYTAYRTLLHSSSIFRIVGVFVENLNSIVVQNAKEINAVSRERCLPVRHPLITIACHCLLLHHLIPSVAWFYAVSPLDVLFYHVSYPHFLPAASLSALLFLSETLPAWLSFLPSPNTSCPCPSTSGDEAGRSQPSSRSNRHERTLVPLTRCLYRERRVCRR